GNGLFLQVDRSVAKRWIQRITVHGKRRDIGLGPYSDNPKRSPGLTLAEARERAVANRIVARSGGDPLAAKKKVDMTFSEAADLFDRDIAAARLNEKNRKQWCATLDRYALPTIGALKVRDISTSDIEQVLRPIWRTRTETASRLRARLEAILAFAKSKGARSGENPASWKGNLEFLFPAASKIKNEQHRPAISLIDLVDWWKALAARDGIAARALQFQTLTAARSGEVRGMTWHELDMDDGVWIVPSYRMKARKEHRVPLSAAALELLSTVPRTSSEIVFGSPKGGMISDMSISSVMKRINQSEQNSGRRGFVDPQSMRPAVPHGLRSTFRDWVAERTNYPGEMAELALAHKISSATEAAYRRGDMFSKRRKLMDDWAAFLAGSDVPFGAQGLKAE
ncbi:MAG: tyrosine-type recombinase/integrase, partial [Myxococcota bacterium]